MLGDKISYFKVNGHWFALLGVANALAYMANLFMSRDQFKYHFAYTAYPARMFKPLKSQIGSDTFANVIWTAPTLIGLSLFMHKKVGSLIMTKLFFLSLLSTSVFLSAVNPDSGLNYRPLRKIFPKFDSFADDGSYYMGADQMTQSLVYFTLIYHRYWMIALPFMAFDLLYYGPATLGGLFAGTAAGLMFV